MAATSQKFFKDPKNEIVKEDLFSKIAKQEVEKFLIFYTDKKTGKKKASKGTPSSTQIRKFFNDLLIIKQKIENTLNENSKDLEFKRQLPYIKMLKAKVAYAKSRDNVNQEFVDFIEKYIDEVNEKEDFFVLCDFFEAIIAYSKALYK